MINIISTILLVSMVCPIIKKPTSTPEWYNCVAASYKPNWISSELQKDTIGSYWRAYEFIEDATCFEMVKEPDDFYQSAIAFGNFQKLLADYPTESLHETIPNFHNTPLYFETFRKAVENDILNRAEEVKEEIDFIMEREAFAHILLDLHKEGKLPLKVTHNDTKLNNIMIDNKTGRGICVIGPRYSDAWIFCK